MSRVSGVQTRRGLIAFVAAVLVFAMLGVGAAEIARSRAAGRLRDETELVLIQARAENLEALEWQAIAERSLPPDRQREILTVKTEILQNLGELPELPRVAVAYSAYESAFDAELSAVGAGDIARAKRIDATRTDPSAERMNAVLGTSRSDLARSARQASLVARLVGWLAALLTAIGTGFLAWRVMGAYRRVTTAEAERRVADERVARLREIDQVKDDFVATVSHELRTPLTSIIGYLELLETEADTLPPEHHEFLRVIDRNAERLLGLVNDLLVIAQADSGRFELAPVPFSPQELVDDALASSRPVAESRQITLNARVTPLPDLVGDPARLAQLLDNLVSNAMKFTPPTGTIEIVAERAGDALALEVSDTGIGIPQAEQDRLFERFYRTSAAQQGAVAGTGLGLSIVKLIAEAHGGAVAVKSDHGVGTTFRVVLPLAVADSSVRHAA